jgi:hypothetical protein
MAEWIYNNQEFSETPSEYYGFVYLIENTITNKKYIGKKWFWSTRRVKQKGKTRRKIVKNTSDWLKYYGSNEELLADIKEHGTETVKRTILHLCKTKGDCSYYEAKEQFDRNVLYDDSYYNNWIILKIHKSHLTR